MLAMDPAYALHKGHSRLIEHLSQQSVRQLSGRVASTSSSVTSPASSLEQLVAGAQLLQADASFQNNRASHTAEVQRQTSLSSRPDLPLDG